MGGSTNEGITSGLKRAKYEEGKRVTTEDILRDYGPAPRSSNVYDFLIDFGLNIASMPPQGNIISTAAAAARDPFSRFTEGKSKGEQLAYAMRAQASDTARNQNLAEDKMDLQKYLSEQKIKSAEKIADINAQKEGKQFTVKPNRLSFVASTAENLSDSKNIVEKMYPMGMAEWESVKNYDGPNWEKGNVKLAPLKEGEGKNRGIFNVDDSKFTEEDQFNIYWDPVSREWFTISFDEAGMVQIDKSMSAAYGDAENDYVDSSLQNMQNFIEEKREATEIQTLDSKTLDENNLGAATEEMTATTAGLVHPTDDMTAEGEISDEYAIKYAAANKIPIAGKDDYRGKGGKSYWKSMPIPLVALKNKLKRENQSKVKKTQTKEKRETRSKDQAFNYFSRVIGDKTIYEKIKEGSMTMSNTHAPYLKEYEDSLTVKLAEAN